jgi:hypothetical protein
MSGMADLPESIDIWKNISTHYFGKPKKGVVHIVHRVTNQPLCNQSKIVIVEQLEEFLLSDIQICNKCSKVYSELYSKKEGK